LIRFPDTTCGAGRNGKLGRASTGSRAGTNDPRRLRGRGLAIPALLVEVALAAAAFGVASVQNREYPAGFTEDFEGGRLDIGVWEIGDHPLGRGALRPQNVSLAEEELRISLPAGSLDGGEVNTQSQQEYGSCRVRMQVPDSPGSVTGYFLYRPPDYENGVDTELYNHPDGRRLVTTYSGGDPEPTNCERVELPFDPTQGFHDYRFDYGPNGVVFYAKESPCGSSRRGFPSARCGSS
jgi:endo-1,3-1,4-beta-glycanase ExoK